MWHRLRLRQHRYDFYSSLFACRYGRSIALEVQPEADLCIVLPALKACGVLMELEAGRKIHNEAMQRYASNIYIANTLINVYAKCGSIQEARMVFNTMSLHNVVSWNTLILGYVENGDGKMALQLFRAMQNDNHLIPNARTFAAVAKACGCLAEKEPGKKIDGKVVKVEMLAQGREIQAQAAKLGCDHDVFLGSSFIDMYGRCGSPLDARKVFEKMPARDQVSWNALMLGCAENGEEHLALDLFSRMENEGCTPNARSFVAALKACAGLTAKEEVTQVEGKPVKLASLQKGMAVHTRAAKSGCEQESFVASTLVDMYAKCGSLTHARTVFNKILGPTEVAFNALMLGYADNGDPQAALDLFSCMEAQGCPPDARSFVAAAKACSSLALDEAGQQVDGKFVKIVSLQRGMSVHNRAVRGGFSRDIFVASTLVDMYAKCGSMVDAQKVFDGMSSHNVVAWTALILGYADNESEGMALDLFFNMQTQGCAPNSLTFIAALKACAGLASKEIGQLVDGKLLKANSLMIGRDIHSQAARRHELNSDAFLLSSLVVMYAKCGSLVDAWKVFNSMLQPDVVLWNSLLLGCVENGEEQMALQLFGDMQRQRYIADSRTYVAALKACTGLAMEEEAQLVQRKLIKVRSLDKGMDIHSKAAHAGYGLDIFVATTLVDMYGKCGDLAEALRVYNKMPAHNLVLSTALMLAYVENAEERAALKLFDKIPCAADAQSYVTALKACAGLATKEEGRQVDGRMVKVWSLEKGASIHRQATKSGLELDLFVANTLVDMYAKCGNLVEAQRVFDRIPTCSQIAWNVLMLGYARAGEAETVLKLFTSMETNGCAPDAKSYVAALKACSTLAVAEDGVNIGGKLLKVESLERAICLHSQAAKCGYATDIFVACGLVDVYGKCASMVDARRIFDKLPVHNAVLWNNLILGYVDNGEEELALEVFCHMKTSEGCEPDAQSFVAALKACTALAAKGEDDKKVLSLEKGKSIHAAAVRRGYDSDMFVVSTMVNMYAKCGSLGDAQQVFNRTSYCNVVAWNALILGYVENKQEDQALELFFSSLELADCHPDEATFVAVLKACGNKASLEITKLVCAEVYRLGLESSSAIGNTLVDVFGKCGNMNTARQVFDSLTTRSLITWNALLAGYSHQGDSGIVFNLFRSMHEEGLKVNGITFVPVLTACSHAGLVEKCKCYFQAMSSVYGISPDLEHYHCMVDALGRANELDAAIELVKSMPMKPNEITWITVLGACRKWKNVEVGKLAWQHLVGGKGSACYTLMANLYGSAE